MPRRPWVPEKQYRVCVRKIRHYTMRSAKEHMRKLDDPGLHVYLCPYCGRYHVGHDRKAA